MDIFSELMKRMSVHSGIEEKKVVTDSISYDGTKLKVRDYLMEIGTILEYDEESDMFIVVIKAGIGDKNPAIVGVSLKDKMLYIAAYAKEGFINQKTAEKAIHKILSLVG